MLKSLELSGFKSFADRTRFDFDPGVTGVVGPNGSGKSNVVDALKWILGVQSAKSLRGKSMLDVIFNGATGRKPANAAEATLHFDNRQRTLAIDLDEVRIGRRLLRSGDSEYLVNDNAVRLKDVVNLFMGTGAGSNAYSIIEQGRVDQILHANAATRRKVFDEAAGISRFRSDRAEAERKLERVEQNLVRLRDIVDEVEARLNSVRTQAEKAAKYRALTEELRELWWGLAADDCRAIDVRLADLEAVEADDGEQQAEFERRRGELDARLADAEDELGRIENACRTADRALARQREGAASHETTIRHERDRIVDLDADVMRLRRQRATLAVREREAVLEAERSNAQLAAFEREFDELVESLDDHETSILAATAAAERARSTVERNREQLLEAVKQGSKLDNDVAALEAEVQSLVRDRAGIDASIVELDVEIDASDERGRIAVEAEEEATEAVTAAKAIRDGVRDRRAAIIDQLDEFQKAIANRREARSAGQARKTVLEDLESRREGFGIGVREILDRARTVTEPPWNMVRGTAADLLEVDLEHAAVIEVALADRAQTIVVEDITPLREYLGNGGAEFAGRVGFVQYARPAATSDGHLPDLSAELGVKSRADHLVRSPDTLPGLAGQLLADTWVVDSLDVAYRLVADGANDRRRCRFVTPLGELLEADGSLRVGTVRAESAVVSRRSELRRLRDELATLDRRIESEQDRAELLGSDLVAVEGELEAADGEVRASTEVLAARRANVERHAAESHRLRQESAAASRRLGEIDDRAEGCASRLEAMRERRTEFESTVTDLRGMIDDAEADVEREMSHVRNGERARDEQRVAVAKQEERLEGLRSARDRIRSDVDQRHEQLLESRRRVGVVEEKRRTAVLHLLNARAALDECLLDRDRLGDESTALATERERLRAARAEISAKVGELRDEQRRSESRRHENEIELRDLRHRRGALVERIDDEYQTTIEAIVASGASALATYRAEHGERHDASTADESNADEIAFDEIRDEVQGRVDRLRRKIKSMGAVGIESLHDLDELETRFERLSTQLEDLEHARDELRDVVRRINGECKRLFIEAFDTIRGHFRELFRKLFGGGEGDVVLEDPSDPLECGVEIIARPPGKELRNLSLLSGGEKTMTAVALLMAIFKSKPSPFCVLDEVDAALDEANVERYNNVLKEFADSTQFIVITHRKPTMTVCDVLYGVTMEQSGVSTRMTVRFEDVNENGEFKVPKRAA